MKILKALLPAAAIAMFGLVTAAQAQDDLPKADVVMKKFVEVTGGMAKYKAIKSQASKGKISVPEMGMEGTMEIKQILPDKMAVKAQLGAIGSESSGSNGKHMWSVSTMTGARLIEGKEAQQMQDQGSFERIYSPATYYSDMQTMGIEEVEGEKCYKIELTKKSGDKQYDFYSIESGLQVKSIQPIEIAQMGTVNISSIISDYKDVGGIKAAHKITQQLPNGMSQVIEFTEMKYNVDIPESTFAIPAEIQKLIDKKEAKSDQKEGAGK